VGVSATVWLIDKSALIRLSSSPVRDEWFERIARGLVRITTLTMLEIGYTARSGTDLQDELHRPPLALMPMEYLTPASESRAMAVQALLAERGLHRAPSVADLLIAASAELTGATVLHVDKDFDLIASVTGQPVETLKDPPA
jgi:predicted nucleic acid-binding protein